MRSGFRSDDVQLLVRTVRAHREKGLGPDEAWEAAKQEIPDVLPEVFEAWRPDIEQKVEDGTAHSPVTNTTNILARLAEQDEQLAILKAKLVEAGKKYEALVAEAKAKLAVKDEEISSLTAPPKKK